MPKKDQFLKLDGELLDSLPVGRFEMVGNYRGTLEFLILMREPLNAKRLTPDYTIDLNQNSEFQHFFVLDVDDSVVGSILRVRSKFANYSPLAVSRVLDNSTPTPTKCVTENASGGLYMFTDDQGSCLALAESAKTPISSLVITGDPR